jgi:hypothetical protein
VIDLLSQLIHNFVCWIETAIMVSINAIIYALGTVISGLLAILPTMPDPPTMPTWATDALGWVAWVFPVGTLLDVIGFLVAAFLLWFGVSIALRWAKAVS